jgi:hypothetical protein
MTGISGSRMKIINYRGLSAQHVNNIRVQTDFMVVAGYEHK